jgi:hypothetical protein
MTAPNLSVSVRTPNKILNGVRKVALVQSESDHRVQYQVLVIDGKFQGRRRRLLTCDCPDHFFREEGRLRGCKHTRRVRQVLKGRAA